MFDCVSSTVMTLSELHHSNFCDTGEDGYQCSAYCDCLFLCICVCLCMLCCFVWVTNVTVKQTFMAFLISHVNWNVAIVASPDREYCAVVARLRLDPVVPSIYQLRCHDP